MSLAQAIVAWQLAHGRRDLPWQRTRDPYRIWLSEVMLQQTQVATVIPYFEAFIARFPKVQSLAEADLDAVLSHWSGLGYYSRARNLHRAAREICRRYRGCFPATFDEVVALPGVGRSTAGAIMVFAYGARYPILEGNVKRVLARACGIEGYPGDKRTADALWRSAERLLPVSDLESYTQGLMDLGATVCRRRNPACGVCPIAPSCVARNEHRVDSLPSPRPRKALPHRKTVMLVLEHAGKLLLEKRPAPGIWGGLWCFPELEVSDDAEAAALVRFGAHVRGVEVLSDVEHGFTHYRLTISPRCVRVRSVTPSVNESSHRWFSPEEIRRTGIPAPVRLILEQLQTPSLFLERFSA